MDEGKCVFVERLSLCVPRQNWSMRLILECRLISYHIKKAESPGRNNILCGAADYNNCKLAAEKILREERSLWSGGNTDRS